MAIQSFKTILILFLILLLLQLIYNKQHTIQITIGGRG